MSDQYELMAGVAAGVFVGAALRGLALIGRLPRRH